MPQLRTTASVVALTLVMLALASCGQPEPPARSASESTRTTASEPGMPDGLDLVGVQWILTRVGSRDAVADAEGFIAFDPDTVSGTTGCNNFTGGYELHGHSIEIGPVGTTQMACSGPVGVQEQAFLKALDATKRYTVDDDTLTLTDDDGKALLEFQAKPGPSPTTAP